MKTIFKYLFISLSIAAAILPQGFNIPGKGEQTFIIKDTLGRNQASFFSEAPFENITGISNDVRGEVSFELEDIAATLTGVVSISTVSIKTGIEQRDEHLQSVSWLYAEKFPEILFRIKDVNSIDLTADNVIKLVVLGEFEMRGKTKLVYAYATMKYLVQSEMTKTILPGDLIGITARFEIKLDEFGIQNQMIGKRVANDVEINVFLTGSNGIMKD